MLDVIALLRREHRTLQLLFEEYMTADDRKGVAAEICTELLLHMAGEEEVVYPAVEDELQGGNWLVRQALEEHQQLTDAIIDLDRLGYDHADADEMMRDIIAVATRHIDEEERGLLLDLKIVLQLDELAELGDELDAARARREADLVEPEPAPAPEPEPAPEVIDLTELSRRELYQMATDEGIAGRSRMSRDELIDALATDEG